MAEFFFKRKVFRNLEKLKNNKKALNCGWTQSEAVEECKIDTPLSFFMVSY